MQFLKPRKAIHELSTSSLSNINELTYVVESDGYGQRIDNFLFSRLKGVPKSHVYRLLRTGKIRVNGERVKQTHRLKKQDKVLVPALRLATKKTAVIADNLIKLIQSSILYEDESIIAINKPSGMAVHPGSRVSFGVIEVLRAARPHATFLELVHRLDRGTSGCLLVAKNRNILSEVHELLRTRSVEKEYLALVRGQWKHNDETIFKPLKIKHGKPGNLVEPDQASQFRTAVTSFSLQKVFSEHSLIRVRISTGRTHQIRIHAAQMGHPVAGDRKYGDFAFNRACRKNGLSRMFLHATRVAFECRSNGVKYAITAPMDEELKRYLNKI